MHPVLLEKLISPDDRSTLVYSKAEGQLVSKKQSITYPISEGVPVLLPQKKNVVPTFETSPNKGHFDYIDHYQNDATEFDYFEETTDPATLHENNRLHEAILGQVPKNVQHLLDLGCGSAWVARAFQGKNVRVCSFDVSTTNPIKALKKYPSDNHYGITGDVYHLPFRPASFDCIISAEVIEHVPDTATYLANLLQLLKPNGRLIITTPNEEIIPHHLCIHCNRPTPSHAHLHSFDKTKILSLVPNGQAISKKAITFSNKSLLKLQTHFVMKYLPFGVWFFLDKMANRFFKKPTRLMLVCQK